MGSSGFFEAIMIDLLALMSLPKGEKVLDHAQLSLGLYSVKRLVMLVVCGVL